MSILSALISIFGMIGIRRGFAPHVLGLNPTGDLLGACVCEFHACAQGDIPIGLYTTGKPSSQKEKKT